MSDKCADCSCADKSQCTKGNTYGIDIVETDKSYSETILLDAPAAEHDGNCKCGPSCACTNCTCGLITTSSRKLSNSRFGSAPSEGFCFSRIGRGTGDSAWNSA
ncbi:Uncharacterized protein Fot_45039 [Forsythia ovata]|uniref:Uncharacterized protein n=1 Tax=Forsythia ovata TaxID=205694 RepID=A0ABD1R584_9LAMI